MNDLYPGNFPGPLTQTSSLLRERAEIAERLIWQRAAAQRIAQGESRAELLKKYGSIERCAKAAKNERVECQDNPGDIGYNAACEHIVLAICALNGEG